MSTETEHLTINELQSIATAYNLSLRKNASRKTLIAAINEHEARLNDTTANDDAPAGEAELRDEPERASALEATAAAYDDAFEDETQPSVEPAEGFDAPTAPSGVTPREAIPDAAQVPRGHYPQQNGWSVYANGSGLRADCPNCGHSHNAGQFAKCPGCGFAAPETYALASV